MICYLILFHILVSVGSENPISLGSENPNLSENNSNSLSKSLSRLEVFKIGPTHKISSKFKSSVFGYEIAMIPPGT